MGKEFMMKMPKAQAKYRQMKLHQTEKLCTAKETVNGVKRQPTE